MRGEALIGLADQPVVKPFPADARFVACNQQHRSPSRIERKGRSPDSTIRIKSQFLHVRVFRAAERIYPRPLRSGTELLDDRGLSDQLTPHIQRKQTELRL